MAAQGERGQEGLEIDLEGNESMAQDEITVQDTPMQVEFSPQTNPEPEGSAGAAAAFDTPPPSVKFPPRSPVKPRPITVDRSC